MRKTDYAAREKFLKEFFEYQGWVVSENDDPDCQFFARRAEIARFARNYDMSFPAWVTKHYSTNPRGSYRIPVPGTFSGAIEAQLRANDKKKKNSMKKPVRKRSMRAAVVEKQPLANTDSAVVINDGNSLVPSKLSNYVPFGNFSDLTSIITSNIFYPVFVTGLSGNGKTLMIEQIAAREKRELLRVNITEETDEDDLLGGFRLVNGETVWQDGPVILAMERGALLLLDEIDLGSNKIMCLQPVLEGKEVYLKKINRVVRPSAGFNIVATANTKGQGSQDGRFVGTRVLNEAFLERFAITMEQEYPSQAVETKILLKQYEVDTGDSPDDEAKEFIGFLTTWSQSIRKGFYEGSISDVISTRRLVHIIGAYSIFDNQDKALNYCLSRFDDDTKVIFKELWEKLIPEKPAQDEEISNLVDPPLHAPDDSGLVTSDPQQASAPVSPSSATGILDNEANKLGF